MPFSNIIYFSVSLLTTLSAALAKVADMRCALSGSKLAYRFKNCPIFNYGVFFPGLALLVALFVVPTNLFAQSLFAPEGAASSLGKSAPVAVDASKNQLAPAGEAKHEGGAAEIQLDERGKKTIVIRGDSKPSLPRPSDAQKIRSSGGGHILVDEQGNKTLLVHGDAGKSQVMVDSGTGQQTQVVFGDDTAGLIMDNAGHKTLIIRENIVASQSSGAGGRNQRPAHDRPYWMPEVAEQERPYFKADPKTNDLPYWLHADENERSPYWALEEEKHTRPYWLPEAEYVEIIAAEMQLGTANPIESSGGSMSAAPSVGGNKVISYYMYQDEKGVKNLSNIPDDPRYRKFTAVVQVHVGRSGWARGGSLRFTHENLRPIILKAAAVYGLDPALISAVIRSESAFDAKAVSWAGAQGLMQLMPGTARDMGVRDAFDPEQNIMGGSRYIRLMLNEFNGDLTLALAAYNAGPNRVKRNWQVPNIPETKNYVVIVMRNYERYKSQF